MKIFVLVILLSAKFLTLPAQEHLLEEDQRVENQSEIFPGENADDKIKKNFFLRAEVTKTACFVGEPLMATFKAYSRLDANSQVVKRPSLTGFSVMEMVDAYNSLPEVEKYNGKYYNVHLIRKVQLFPLQAGSFTLEAAEVESVIHLFKSDEPTRSISKSSRSSPQEFFRRQFRSNSLIQKQVTLGTPPLRINVKPLPEKGQPEDFSGAVGDFAIQLHMRDSVVQQYEPAEVKLIISGKGNLPLITDPEIDWPKNIRPADPQVTENTDRYNYPLEGIKVFEYVLPSRDTGSFTIPAVKFSFFDPETEKYKTIETKPLNYTVQLSEKKQDLEKIETGKKENFPLHYLYFGIIVAIIIAIIIFQTVRRKK